MFEFRNSQWPVSRPVSALPYIFGNLTASRCRLGRAMYLLYQISSKSVKKCGHFRRKFPQASKQSMTYTPRTSMTHDCFTASRAHYEFRMWPKAVIKCRNEGQKSIYALTQSTAITARSIMKVKISCTAVHLDLQYRIPQKWVSNYGNRG
jgi:hypothetical protein